MTDLNKRLPPVVIPVYQPTEKLVEVVTSLLNSGFEVFLVNDGSSESSRSIFQKLASQSNVHLLENAVNLGKGAALKNAFNHILVHRPEVQGVITVDADGQHHFADVSKVAEEFILYPKNLVLGVRTFRGEIPLRSRFGNILTGHLFHILVGKKLNDTQTGLRAVPRALMQKLLSVKSNRYEFELDMLLISTHMVNIREVPIQTIYEDGNKSSHFHPLIDSVRIYFVLFRFVLSSLIAYGVDLAVFTLVFSITNGILKSIIAGRFVSLLFVTFASKEFVFKSKDTFVKVFSKMFVLWLFLLGLSYTLMLLMVDQFGVSIYASRILVDSALFLVNFVIQRSLIFRREEEVWA